MFASFFTTVIVQPIFNLLVVIYALIPGHNFGLAIILFTVAVRYLMYPLLKKQLYHTKAMRSLQPELKRIKKEAAGDRQKESMLTMALYKERQINPLASLGLVIVQIPLFLALFSCLKRIVNDPNAIIDFSYSWVRDLSWMKTLATDIKQFDNTLFGLVDLNRAAVGSNGAGTYWPAMLLVLGSSVVQYFQIKQTMPTDKEARKLKQILKEAGEGKTADQGEVNAALSRNMSYIFPVMIFFLTVSFAAALSLYWFVGGVIAYLQQDYLLKKDKEILALDAQHDEAARLAKAQEAEIIKDYPKNKKPKAKKVAAKQKKRR
jgi:YidC/Oxa1 family membrane protein insertase